MDAPGAGSSMLNIRPVLLLLLDPGSANLWGMRKCQGRNWAGVQVMGGDHCVRFGREPHLRRDAGCEGWWPLSWLIRPPG